MCLYLKIKTCYFTFWNVEGSNSRSESWINVNNLGHLHVHFRCIKSCYTVHGCVIASPEPTIRAKKSDLHFVSLKCPVATVTDGCDHVDHFEIRNKWPETLWGGERNVEDVSCKLIVPLEDQLNMDSLQQQETSEPSAWKTQTLADVTHSGGEKPFWHVMSLWWIVMR